jgi:hypothetical protein
MQRPNVRRTNDCGEAARKHLYQKSIARSYIEGVTKIMHGRWGENSTASIGRRSVFGRTSENQKLNELLSAARIPLRPQGQQRGFGSLSICHILQLIESDPLWVFNWKVITQ